MALPDATIVYYTANVENESFEKKIRENILKQTNLPIISVSRKPIDFGKNICIGEQDVCYANSFKQLLIGLKEAKTKFCIAAESDCLYPPEYFQFTPPTEDNAYRYTNIWVHFDGRSRFWSKRYVEAAQMCGREFWIKNIERVLAGKKDWKDCKVNPPFIFTTKDKYSWTGKPVLYFKTRQGIGFKTGFIEGAKTSIPYWGSALEIENKYL